MIICHMKQPNQETSVRAHSKRERDQTGNPASWPTLAGSGGSSPLNTPSLIYSNIDPKTAVVAVCSYTISLVFLLEITLGIHQTIPITRWDLSQGCWQAVEVKPSVATVTEEHLLFITRWSVGGFGAACSTHTSHLVGKRVPSGARNSRGVPGTPARDAGAVGHALELLPLLGTRGAKSDS
eukprot:1196136-Prorocentrum_minimum.AAC.4